MHVFCKASQLAMDSLDCYHCLHVGMHEVSVSNHEPSKFMFMNYMLYLRP